MKKILSLLLAMVFACTLCLGVEAKNDKVKKDKSTPVAPIVTPTEEPTGASTDLVPNPAVLKEIGNSVTFNIQGGEWLNKQGGSYNMNIVGTYTLTKVGDKQYKITYAPSDSGTRKVEFTEPKLWINDTGSFFTSPGNQKGYATAVTPGEVFTFDGGKMYIFFHFVASYYEVQGTRRVYKGEDSATGFDPNGRIKSSCWFMYNTVELKDPIYYSVKYILRDENQQFVKELGSKDNIKTFEGELVNEVPANFEDQRYFSDNPDEVVNRTVSDGEVIYFYYHELPIHYSVEHILRKADGTEVLLDAKTDVEIFKDELVYETPNNYDDREFYSDNPEEVVNRTVSDGEVIKFYYHEAPIHYSVKYILRDENQQFVRELGSKDDVEAYKNDPVTETPANFEADRYICDDPDEVITKTVADGEVIYFYYHELPIHYSVKYILRDKNQHFVKELGSKDDIEVYKDVSVTEKPENFEADGYVCDDPDEVITKTVADGEVIKFYYHEAPIHYSIVYYYDADTSIEGDEVEIYREDNLEAMKDESVRVRSPQTYSDGTTVYVLNRPNNQTAKVYDGYEFKIYYTLSDEF